MKQITRITAAAFLAISVISCSKSSSGYSPVTSLNQPSARQEPVKVRIISDWLSLALSSTMVDAIPVLQGQSTLANIVSYQVAAHKQLAYVRIPGRDGAIYKALPANYATVNGNHVFNFSLDFNTFTVSINNADIPARQLNAQDFTGFQYRFIILPVEVYQSFQINWDDLSAVAAALNFSL